MRGDIITKIQDYDARDIRNIDAQNLFRSAGNHIRLVVRRDCKLAVATNIQSPDIRPLTPCSLPPYQPEFNLLHVDFDDRAIQMLPKTDFQHISADYTNGGRPESRASSRFSPMLTRDHQQEIAEETAAIATQVSIESHITAAFTTIRARSNRNKYRMNRTYISFRSRNHLFDFRILFL